ncbi:MAG: formate dehydrogenase family accessory protein FdhD [Bacteroidetes bacterium MedPE-SWsnd-G1]|nr:MAG: formate dehydrogenase family accessory protein FdhD [Bacteroidetes bacterium MedPE-SWsnd-G1]
MSKSTKKYEAVKSEGANTRYIFDTIVLEAPLQININNKPYTVVMRTPGKDEFLIRGLLYAEDIYKGDKNFGLEIVEDTPNFFTIINLTINEDHLGNGYLNKRTLLSVSSCGVCGKQTLDSLETKGAILAKGKDINWNSISIMLTKMQEQQKTFTSTGASHAASLFNNELELLSIQEDIGRHNAVDKVIGELKNKKQLKNAKFLLVSGRVSYEIVTKAFIAKINTIIAVSGCSSLAIDFAKEFGIKLIGFARDGKSTIYS